MAERIIREVDRIGRAPQIRPEDPDAPSLPGDARARRVTVSGYTIRYIYPFMLGGRARVLIVSIQRGVRVLEKPEYLLRWLEERAKSSG